jgi:hypothetical protein
MAENKKGKKEKKEKKKKSDAFDWLMALIILLALGGGASQGASQGISQSASQSTGQASLSQPASSSTTQASSPAATPVTASATPATADPSSTATSAVPVSTKPDRAQPAFHGHLYLHSSLPGTASGAVLTASPTMQPLRQMADSTAPTTAPTGTSASGVVFLNLPVRTTGCAASNGLPDSRCTPGVTFDVGLEQICAPGYLDSVPSVSEALQRRVYAAYGVTSHVVGQYQIDHLVPLELGGSNDFANLWPEAANPYPGFREKDVVENDLHRAVCLNQMPLAVAQSRIASYWKQTGDPLSS